MGSKIYIANEQDTYEMSCAFCCVLENVIRATLLHEHFFRQWEISLTLTNDEKIQKLNKKYRNKDKPTDVLSFPQYSFENGDKPKWNEVVVLGDIVINTQQCARQAKELQHSFEREAAFLCVHSVLHLLGYDHERSQKEDEEMCAIQREIIQKIGL